MKTKKNQTGFRKLAKTAFAKKALKNLMGGHANYIIGKDGLPIIIE